MTYLIKLVQAFIPFEALQLRKWILGAVRKIARECGKSGDFESWSLLFFIVAAVRNI